MPGLLETLRFEADETPRACDRIGMGGGPFGGDSDFGSPSIFSMPLMLGRTGKRPPVTTRLGGRGVSALLWYTN